MRKLFPLVLLCLANSSVLALESLDDQQLSETTGQDGLTISIIPAASGVKGMIGMQEIAYTDGDGFSTTINNGSGVLTSYLGPASVITNFNTNSGVLFCTNTTGVCTLSQNPITLRLDADGAAGAGGSAMIYGRLALPTNVNRIKLDIANLALRADQLVAGKIVKGSTEIQVTQFSNGIDLRLAAPMQIGLALGSERSSNINMDAMINLISANFSAIDFGTVSLVSSGGQANESSLRADISLTNLDLSGANIDVSANGLVFSKASIGPFNVRINNVTAGNTAAAPSATLFNGTRVGTLGSFGINNMTVTNAQVAISGL
jgi:hypothetical protein